MKRNHKLYLNKYILIIICVIILPGIFYYLKLKFSMKKRRSKPVKQRLDIMKELFHDVADIANNNDIKIFLLYGTLLGEQRNNKLICYDYDVDVGVLTPDFNKLKDALKKHINQNKYELIITDLYLSKKIEIMDKKSQLSIDIFAYKKTSNGFFQRDINFFSYLYFAYILNQCNQRDIPKDWLLPLRPVSFLGKNVYIPNNPQAFLNCEYGLNYLTPDHKCNQDCSKCIKV
jgi:hypothetical protein